MKDIELNMKTIYKVLIAHKLTIVSQQIISMRNNGLIICQTRFPLWWRLQKNTSKTMNTTSSQALF